MIMMSVGRRGGQFIIVRLLFQIGIKISAVSESDAGHSRIGSIATGEGWSRTLIAHSPPDRAFAASRPRAAWQPRAPDGLTVHGWRTWRTLRSSGRQAGPTPFL